MKMTIKVDEWLIAQQARQDSVGELAGAPEMVDKDEVQGLFDLLDQSPYFLKDDQMGFFQTLGQQRGIAIYNAYLFQEVKQSRERLQLLAGKVVEAQEEERRRIARELHDEAGQLLTGLMLHLKLMRGSTPNSPQLLADHLDEAIQLTDETMESIRRLAHGLRPPALDVMELNLVMENICQEFGRRSRITVHYQGEKLGNLPDTLTVTFYRILQESLTNIIKHAAEATNVAVALRRENGRLVLSVRNNGRGIDHSKITNGGVGLIGIQERLQLLGGTLTITAPAEGGTQLLAYAPLPDQGFSAGQHLGG